MFIIEMSMYESDFILKNTKRSGAYDIRTFDINHQLSLFVYYYDDYCHLKLRRYGNKITTIADWYSIQLLSLSCPTIDLNKVEDFYMDTENNQLHIKVPYYSVYKGSDDS